MFVFPMLGLSSRFFDAGFQQPKYKLNIWGETVFSQSVKSFSRYFSTDKFLFIVRADYNASDFVKIECEKLGIKDYEVVLIENDTMGQADTVYLGLGEIVDDEELYIFNIDTFRYDFKKPILNENDRGFLEVFIEEGDNWSFIEAGKDNTVLRTTEKDRISDLCSNGLYYFKSVSLYCSLFEEVVKKGGKVKGEYYIAPMYNFLIASGVNVIYRCIDRSEVDLCGTPKEYQALLGKPLY